MNLSVDMQSFRFHRLFSMWVSHSRTFYLIVFFLVFGLGLSAWYENVYRGDWSEEEKRIFIESSMKEIEFRESDFDWVVKMDTNRAERHAADIPVLRDLFFPDPTLRIP